MAQCQRCILLVAPACSFFPEGAFNRNETGVGEGISMILNQVMFPLLLFFLSFVCFRVRSSLPC